MRPVFPPCRSSRCFLVFLTCASLGVAFWLAGAVAAAPDLSTSPAPLSQPPYPPPPTATAGPSRTPRPIPVLPSPTATPATPLPTAAPPANDTCATAQVLPSTGPWPLTVTQDTRGATMDPNEPPVCGGDTTSHSVWYRFVAPTDGWLVLDTCGSDYDTVLIVWEGECGATGQSALMCNDDDCGLQSRLWAPTSAGLSYLVRVSSYGMRPGGALSLSVEFRIQPTPTPTPTFTLVPPTSTRTPYPPPGTAYPSPTPTAPPPTLTAYIPPTARPTNTPFAPQPTLTTPQPVTLVPPPTVVGTPTPRCAPNPYPAPDCPTPTPPAPAYTGSVSIYRLPGFDGSPRQITVGPDGALWFTEYNTGKIGRVSLSPVEIIMFPLPATNRQPFGITAGPDGAVWFTEQSGGIGRITPTGAVTEYALVDPPLLPRYITTGPDGALWFTAYDQSNYSSSIGRLTTDGVLTIYPLPEDFAVFFVGEIVSGLDGAVWFNTGGGGIGRLNPDGALTLFPHPFPGEALLDLVVGPDGAIWTAGDTIMRLGPDGAYRVVYSLSDNDAATAITVGPDGALWFTTRHNQIGRLTLDGGVTYYDLPAAVSRYGATDIVTGPDGALWFTLAWNNAIGRLDPAAPVITQTPTPTTVQTLAPPMPPPGPSFTPTPRCGPQPYPAPGCAQPTAMPVRYGGVNLYTVPSDGNTELGLDQMVVGPDDALWFTESAADTIGRLTLGGEITEYAVPSGGGEPRGITVGPDGALWFVERRGNRVGRITTDGLFFTQTLPRPDSYPRHIVTGPDGALWFAGDGPWLSRLDLNGPVTEYRLPLSFHGINDLTVGPDGALWFAAGYNIIGRFWPDQGVTLFRTPSDYSFPARLTTGPDAALWFVGRHAGRLSLDGVFREFRIVTATSAGGGHSIIRGPDSALWFAQWSTYGLSRLTTDGALTEYQLLGIPDPLYANINDLVLGPDGAIWMTLSHNRIARFDPAAPALPTPTATLTPTPYPFPLRTPTATLFVPPAPTIPPYPYPRPTLTPSATSAANPTSPLPTLTTPQPVTLLPPPTIVGTATPRCAPHPYPAPDCPTPTPLSTPGRTEVSVYRLPGNSGGPRKLTMGPDHALWFTWGDPLRIGRMTLAPVEITLYPLPSPNRQPSDITAGPDGAVWYTDTTGRIGRITPTGNVTEYSLAYGPITPHYITSGRDGALWFTASSGPPNSDRVGRLTPDGILTEYIFPNREIFFGLGGQIAAGQDGALWFTDHSQGVGRLTSNGQLSIFPRPFGFEFIRNLIAGPDGAIWVTSHSLMRLGADGAYRVVYAFPEDDGPIAITSEANSAVWFTTYSGEIRRLTLDGAVRSYERPHDWSIHDLTNIVVGSDTAVWFGLRTSNSIVRLQPDPPPRPLPYPAR